MSYLSRELSERAERAGLVVLTLREQDCPHGPCFLIILNGADGVLWAEGSHESEESVRTHIANYVARSGSGERT